jgi:hypothetical protein
MWKTSMGPIWEDEDWENRLLQKLMTPNTQRDKAKIKMVVVLMIPYFYHAMPVEHRKIQLQQIGGPSIMTV